MIKKPWNEDYAPGWGIVNAGIGMATSQDISEWLDNCASQNSGLWQTEPEQLTCEENSKGDNTWLSQRLIELNVVMASVAQSRNAGMYTLYNTFVDNNALSRGYWYAGNKYFWNLDFNADKTEEFMYGIVQNRQSNDTIHPNHLGYQAFGSTLDTILKMEKSNIKQTPFAYRDGCFIEPNDPGPYEECMTKNFHEWENGTCVDKTPAPRAPVVVVNPTPPPPAPTRESPRPAASDNTLLLIGACFFFGVCHL